MNLYMDYVAKYHTDEVDTNFVFIKLSGENKYQPMEYPDVYSLFLKDCVKKLVYPFLLPHIDFGIPTLIRFESKAGDLKKLRSAEDGRTYKRPCRYIHIQTKKRCEKTGTAGTSMRTSAPRPLCIQTRQRSGHTSFRLPCSCGMLSIFAAVSTFNTPFISLGKRFHLSS